MNILKRILPYLFVAVCLVFGISVQAATIEVNSVEDSAAQRLDVGGYDNDGYCTLREAIGNANADSIIHFDCAAGDGADVISLEGLSGLIRLKSELPTITGSTKIIGPGAEVLGVDVLFWGYRIFKFESHKDNPLKMTVHGLRLLRGRPELASGRPGKGGAIMSINSLLTVSSCELASNKAESGGAIYAVSEADLSELLIVNSLFYFNFTNTLKPINRGSVHLQAGDSVGNGGAVFVDSGIQEGGQHTLEVTNSSFEENFSVGAGAGLYIGASVRANIHSSMFLENESGSDGGGVYVSSQAASLDIGSTTIHRNSSWNDGGGIYGDVRLVNSTVSENLAGGTGSGERGVGYGGGLFFLGNRVSELANTTISGNEVVEGNGGGIFVPRDMMYKPMVANSIIGGNSRYIFPENTEPKISPNNCAGAESVESRGFNIFVSGDGCDQDAISTDTVIKRFTGILDSEIKVNNRSASHAGDHYFYKLWADVENPAINGGNPRGCYTSRNESILVDQTGAKRPEGEACEIGAVELNSRFLPF